MWVGRIIVALHHIHTQIPPDDRSARRRKFYFTTHKTHKRKVLIGHAGFEPVIPASKQPQNHSLDCATTGIGNKNICVGNIPGLIQTVCENINFLALAQNTIQTQL